MGGKRKKTIVSINDGDNILTEMEDIRIHIPNYYKKLFGSESEPIFHLREGIWPEEQMVSVEDNFF